jgi:hypothetical protein
MNGVNKKEKKELLDKLDSLDKKELDVKQCLNLRLSQLLREEEIKLYQCSKAKHLLDDDTDTKYFHLQTNGRHRKARIFQLQDGSNMINGEDELKTHYHLL